MGRRCTGSFWHVCRACADRCDAWLALAAPDHACWSLFVLLQVLDDKVSASTVDIAFEKVRNGHIAWLNSGRGWRCAAG